MSTPICDFVRRYRESNPLRLHMPGHKGEPVLGFEPLDITEIDGADELFMPTGIIAESESQAGALFGAHTCYSAGGSTLCIQAMLYLVALYAASNGKKPRILAARNAHRAFINAAALLDIEIQWLYPPEGAGESYIGCAITPEQVTQALIDSDEPLAAVYVTSPDYLGNMLDIQGIAAACHQRSCLLLVDNAHGAYLKFLPHSRHPMDLGADICCDSAHKTLPVVTGGAYLHISHTAPQLLVQRARDAMALFGSSSPSYLILQSLDAANDRMDDFRHQLADFLPIMSALRQQIAGRGLRQIGTEPLKLTLCPKSIGWTGTALAMALEQQGIFPEFYDPDHVVLMLSPQNGAALSDRLMRVLYDLPAGDTLHICPPAVPRPERVLTPRQAIMAASETLPAEACLGRISAAAALSCPPAIPLVVCGERIDRQVLACMRYYGISACTVVKL